MTLPLSPQARTAELISSVKKIKASPTALLFPDLLPLLGSHAGDGFEVAVEGGVGGEAGVGGNVVEQHFGVLAHEELGVADAVSVDDISETAAGNVVEEKAYVGLVGGEFGGQVGDSQVFAAPEFLFFDKSRYLLHQVAGEAALFCLDGLLPGQKAQQKYNDAGSKDCSCQDDNPKRNTGFLRLLRVKDVCRLICIEEIKHDGACALLPSGAPGKDEPASGKYLRAAGREAAGLFGIIECGRSLASVQCRIIVDAGEAEHS